MNATKKCPKCDETKPLTEFSLRSDRPSGVQSRCKTCQSLATGDRQRLLAAARQTQNREVSLEGEKKCTRCGTMKPRVQFSLQRSRFDGLHHRCKACEKTRKKAEVAKRKAAFEAGECLVPLERRCSACRTLKPAADFYRCCTNSSGLSGKCKACILSDKKPYKPRDREEFLRKARERAPRYRNKIRGYMLLRNYGLHLRDYEALLAFQDGKCAICGTRTPRRRNRVNWFVDHCHRTGRVRGLLCAPCNAALGGMKDDPKILEAAIRYLASPPATSIGLTAIKETSSLLCPPLLLVPPHAAGGDAVAERAAHRVH